MADHALAYLWTDKALRESDAFRGLTKTSILVLLDFHGRKRVKGKRNRWTLLNNGELVYTYREAEKRGISRSAFMSALDQLIVTHQVGTHRCLPRRDGLEARKWGASVARCPPNRACLETKQRVPKAHCHWHLCV